MSGAFPEAGLLFMAISREEAEEQLKGAANGSYLIRPSSRPGCFSLTYKPLTEPRLGHLLLSRTPQGWMTDGVPNVFPTVRALLKRLPYGLRVDDDQMHPAPGNNNASAYASVTPTAPPASGYRTVPPDISAPSGYGKVPKVDDGYGRGPAQAAGGTGDYAAITPTASQASDAYGRAPGAYGTQNVTPGNPDYGRVPASANAATDAAGDAGYGRVPLSGSGGAVSPYARLNPTAHISSPQLAQRASANAVGAGGGYGRVPATEAQGSAQPVPAGVMTTRKSSIPQAVNHNRTASPAPGASGDTPNAYVTARRNLPVSGSPASPSLTRASPASPSQRPRDVPPQASGATPGPSPAARGQARGQGNYASVSVASSNTVNAPHQLAMHALQLMQGNATLAGHERFLRAQLVILAKAKEKAATSTQVYTALVALGGELQQYVNEMRQFVQLSEAAAADAIMRNMQFQQHYIAIQMQIRSLKSLIELGDGFQAAIQSELGHRFWQQSIGKNNSIQWAPFFQVLQATLSMNLTKVESFVRFMFDCNREGQITTQSFNMFIHWFDYEGMRPPTTVKDFLLILIARAENVFFFEGFHGFLSRDQSEKILMNKPPKSYIIRLSDSSAGVFILSYIDSKMTTRHRLLNQVDKQGFMVEQKTYNTLPDLLAAHASVLASAVPNQISFDTPTDSIYGGGDALYESLAAAAMPVLKFGEPYYHAKIVLNRIWLQVRLELRESELTVSTVKSPLRRSIQLQEIAECALCSPPSGSMPCFRVVANNQSHVFGCPDPQDWVQAIQAAASEMRRVTQVSAAQATSADEKMAMSIVTRRADLNEQLPELNRALFAVKRRAGELSPFDQLMMRCVNVQLAKTHSSAKGRAAQAKPPLLFISKIELDMQLSGQKCEVEVPVRDTVLVRNDGGAPLELRFDTLKKETYTLKFVPSQMALAPGQSDELHVTLLVHQTAKVHELVHVSVGPNRGHSSFFLALEVSSKMMEALVFENIDFGPRLGSGAFGQVFHGTYGGREVAIKAVGFEPDFDQELNILRELRQHPNIIEYLGCCAPVDHQMLTNRGFLFLDEVLAAVKYDSRGRVVDWCGLKVANYDPETAQLVYDEPRQLVVKTDARLVEFSAVASNVSVSVTANHDMFVGRDVQGDKFVKMPARRVMAEGAAVRFLARADNGIGGNDVLSESRSSAMDIDDAPVSRRRQRVPKYAGELPAAFVDAGVSSSDVVPFLELYGAWHRCGSGSVSGVDAVFNVADPGEVAFVVEKLDALELVQNRDWVLCDDGRSLVVLCARWRALFGTARSFAGWVWLLPPLALRAIIAGVVERKAAEPVCVTASAAFRDELVRVLLHAGFTASFTLDDDRWRVSFASASEHDRPVVAKNAMGDVANPHKDKRVWCFTMPRRSGGCVSGDGGFVVMRRARVRAADGVVVEASRPTVQGNCKRVPFQGFIVLEFMQLGSLDKYIHDKSFGLTLQYSMRVALDVANGLAHLHRSKIMHLDMKPANVLVSSLSLNSDNDVCVKLADFGLSQSRDSAASFRGEFVEGTLLYMAPEMLREKMFSQKGDIFSFGMTMWEMLKREQPYSGEKHRKLKKPEFEEVRERGELPGEMSEIDPIDVRELLGKMLSFDHEARPSADECARMVQVIRAKLPPV